MNPPRRTSPTQYAAMRENRPMTMRAMGTEAGSRRNERAAKMVTRPPTQRVTPRMCAASATTPTPGSVNSMSTKSVAAAWVPATPIRIAAGGYPHERANHRGAEGGGEPEETDEAKADLERRHRRTYRCRATRWQRARQITARVLHAVGEGSGCEVAVHRGGRGPGDREDAGPGCVQADGHSAAVR